MKNSIFIPTISIITPNFNNAGYLEQTIDSVLSQNIKGLQYIIIDGGSTDKSLEIIKKYQKHLHYWESKNDLGQSDAINKGYLKSSGEIINWLNSDDYYEPNALKIIIDKFQDPSISCVIGRSRLFNEKGTIKILKGTDLYSNNLAKTIGWARMDQPETFFRRNVWETVGLLDVNLHYLMDREFWIRYLFSFGLRGILKIDKVLVNFRIHDHSKTIKSSDEFQIDHDTIFYSIASHLKNKELLSFLLNDFKLNQNYRFPSETIKLIDQKLLFSIINYYLLHRAHEKYYQRKITASRQLINFINPEILKKEDLELYKKINLRSKFLRYLY